MILNSCRRAILFTEITFTALETAKWVMSMKRKKQTRAGAQEGI
jgi:hypothetical protein